jgi:hypothetical protein
LEWWIEYGVWKEKIVDQGNLEKRRRRRRREGREGGVEEGKERAGDHTKVSHGVMPDHSTTYSILGTRYTRYLPYFYLLHFYIYLLHLSISLPLFIPSSFTQYYYHTHQFNITFTITTLSRDIDISGHFGRTPHLLHPALFEIGH